MVDSVTRTAPARPSLILLATLLAASSPARADYPDRGVYAGASLGGNLVLRDWNLGTRATDPTQRPESSSVLGARVGLQIIPRLAIEAELAWLPVKGLDSTTLAYGVNVIYHLLGGRFTPIVEAGGGLYHNVAGTLGADAGPRLHFGVGMRGQLLPWLAVRAELRDQITNSFDKWGAHNLELSAGVDFFVWPLQRKKPAPVAPAPDSDGDGVSDDLDQCPAVPAAPGYGLEGCPDRDGDGVIDILDRCERDVGPPQLHGCPDPDGDGVADPDDACPDVSAGKRPDPVRRGCPIGYAASALAVERREPAREKPAAREKPVAREAAPPPPPRRPPDRDHDQVPDAIDACPDEPGPSHVDPKKNGCKELVKIAGGQIVILEPIVFTVREAEISGRSHRVLDAVVAAIGELPPDQLIVIEGHTDDRGDPDFNQRISERRAQAVLAFLARRGVSRDRLEATGLGPARPLESNDTAEGRARNRRVEFHIVAPLVQAPVTTPPPPVAVAPPPPPPPVVPQPVVTPPPPPPAAPQQKIEPTPPPPTPPPAAPQQKTEPTPPPPTPPPAAPQQKVEPTPPPPAPAPPPPAAPQQKVEPTPPPPAAPAAPASDRDGDGIDDAVDACPDKPGGGHPDPKKHGCPGLVKLENGQLVLREPILFNKPNDAIREECLPVAKALAYAVRMLPPETRVSIESHTDNEMDAEWNDTASTKRANLLVDYLVRNGVARERLEAHGYGSSRPLDPADTPAARRKNRRIEVHLLGPAPAAPAPGEAK